MLAFQGGDDGAFEALVEQYQGAAFSMLRRVLGPGQPVEDLAQEAFLRVWRARERYRPMGRFTTFLYRITWNLALNRLRDLGRRPEARLPEAPDGRALELEDGAAEDPTAGMNRRDWAAHVARALEELPRNQRAALVFQHYDGLGLAEIGEILGISPQAAKSLLHRARERMRELLEPYRAAER